MQTLDISYSMMLGFYALAAVPLLLCYYLKLGIIRTVAAAVARMTVQLVLVALYLELIFRLNSLWLNAAWMMVMLLAANGNVIRSSGLRMKRFFGVAFAGLSAGSVPVVLFFVCVAVHPSPPYDARYLIPITGMVLGNCLRANVIALERFYAGIRRSEQEYLSYLLMGASLTEAVAPYMRQALRAALAPTVSTMATLGLVALPGMMTGQILGGSEPLVAIKYQIAIMLAIFCATLITAACNIRLSLRIALNQFYTLDKSVFAVR